MMIVGDLILQKGARGRLGVRSNVIKQEISLVIQKSQVGLRNRTGI